MKYIADLRSGIEKLIEDKNAFFIGEDIQEPYGGAFKVTKSLSDKYPENIIGVPMCEQGFTGMGIGMALYGCYVSVEIMFGDFITLAADQMINHAAKFRELYKNNIHMVLRCPSGAYRGYGATHSQSLEKIFMGIPGIQVIAPSIAYSPGELLCLAMNSGIPSLFVENKLDYPRDLTGDKGDHWRKEIVQHKNGFPTVIISPIEGEPEVTIVTYGGLLEMAFESMETLLYDEEVNVEIIVPSLLTDVSVLLDVVKTDIIVTLEEGVERFGWGSEISSIFSEKGKKRVRRIGAKNSFIPAAREAELSILPGCKKIMDVIMEELN